MAAALFGSFTTSVGLAHSEASLLDARAYSALLVGSMLPHAFSAATLGGVGRAAVVVVEETKRQFRTMPGLRSGAEAPDSDRCVALCTAAALREMVVPGCLALGVPIATGILFGVRSLSGLLAGILASGLPMAISAACSGGAWGA